MYRADLFTLTVFLACKLSIRFALACKPAITNTCAHTSTSTHTCMHTQMVLHGFITKHLFKGVGELSNRSLDILLAQVRHSCTCTQLYMFTY
jgi:hypothetical protein